MALATRSERMAYRRALRTQLTRAEILAKLSDAMNVRAPRSCPSMAELRQNDPHGVITRVLDSTAGSTGNVLVRTDIEDIITALFVQEFPFWERLAEGQSNGLVHSWNVESATGSLTDSQELAATDTTAANNDTGSYARYAMTNIATLLERRGVSFKEIGAVAASGMTYNPEQEEIESGITRLTDLGQRQMFQGNFGMSNTGTASQEVGLYINDGMDGLRGIIGAQGTYLGGIAVDQDLLGKTITQSINTAGAKVRNRGGRPSLLVMSATAKAALNDEQEGKQRFAPPQTQFIPGVNVDQVQTSVGLLPILDVPGTNALGNYNRTSDGKLVEDIYLLDERMLRRRWLISPDFTVLEIPAGVDGTLTRTYLIFNFSGLQVRDSGYFQAKIRIASTL